MAGITFKGVTKTYSDGTTAVKNFDLEVTDGEFVVLVGPSGCGKTTALRMVAGLEEISGGVLKIGDKIVNHIPSRDRDIAMVFQSYALYPHLSVYDNIAFGLTIKRVPKKEIDRRVHDAARILGLEELLVRKPRALSGGQRQRVAMGRAIVRQPSAFLMDEPLSNLDAKLRVQTRSEIASLQRDLGVTTIYVTHDQVEALTMGDRVAVMRKGELQQVAPPRTLYDRPTNLFVGAFIGSPAMNLFEATLEIRKGRYLARIGDQTIAIEPEAISSRPGLAAYVDREIVLGIRPEDLEDATLVASSPAEQRLLATTEVVEDLGSELLVHAAIRAKHAVTAEIRELADDAGHERTLDEPATSDSATLVGRFGPRSRVRAGESIEVAVETRSLHFFDPHTGFGIYDADVATAAA